MKNLAGLAGAASALAIIGVAEAQSYRVEVDRDGGYVTRVSGETGDVQQTLISGSLRRVVVREEYDVPCRIGIDDDPRADAGWGFNHSTCRRDDAAVFREVWRIAAPSPYVVTGLTACTNRRSDRLKGLRLVYNRGAGDTVSETLPNCRGNWRQAASCPQGQGAYGVRVHFRDAPRDRPDPIVGLQLICGALIALD